MTGDFKYEIKSLAMVVFRWFCQISLAVFCGFLPSAQCISLGNSEALPFLFLITGNSMSNGWNLLTYNWFLSVGLKGQVITVIERTG